jgi:hypothetical protein
MLTAMRETKFVSYLLIANPIKECEEQTKTKEK